ncbi:MAG: histidine kinase [Bacteroidetes bacterium]|nr:histidine kinase [Bacteroidota bacterium]
MKKKGLIAAIHVFAWLAFLSLPTAFKPHMPGMPQESVLQDMMHPHRWANALFLILFFYYNYYIIILKYYFRKDYVFFAATLALCCGIFIGINYLTAAYSPYNSGHGGFGVFGPGYNVYMFIITFIFSFALSFYNQWRITSEEKLNTEISFLKAQINPHFLFNTLNSIYSLALTKSDYTPEAIVKLSGMMRYTISEAHQDKVSLTKELTYITNYVELQRLRMTQRVRISYEVKIGTQADLEIAPFILIPFIENAFKYGVSTEEYSDIIIAIDVTEDDLLMQVSNSKVFVKPDKDMGVGLGITNTRHRLKLLYPHSHAITVTDDPKNFSVSLYLNLQ